MLSSAHRATVKATLLSSVLHGAGIFVIFLIAWLQSSTTLPPPTVVVPSYLISISSATVTPIAQAVSRAQPLRLPTIQPAALPTKQPAPTSKTAPPSHSTTVNSALITALYTAINNHKTYPYAALQLHQQGEASVSFVLFPDGKITQLTLERSSHHPLLDDAALAAVRAASPFILPPKLLSAHNTIRLIIRFQTNNETN